MSTSRTVSVWESALDLTQLSRAGHNLYIAKSVIDSSGKVKYNMVWQSLALAPRMVIQWDVTYCLNWTLQVPFSNTQVTVGGIWQDCAKGEVYDLDKYGMWQPSPATPKDGFMLVGENHYAYSGAAGIHIVIGVKTRDGKTLPIYLDDTPLGLGQSSWYQPQEQVQWWYQSGFGSSTMIDGGRTHVQDYDMSQPRPSDGQYFVSTSYIWATANWITNANDPPKMLQNSPIGDVIKDLGLTAPPGFNDFDRETLS